MGDDPQGLYVTPGIVEAMRERLLPLADVALPNRFEMAELSGAAITSEEEALVAADSLGPPVVVLTSAPEPDAGYVKSLAITAETTGSAQIKRRSSLPKGTGDAFSALYLGHYLDNRDPFDALTQADQDLVNLISANEGNANLDLTALLAS